MAASSPPSPSSSNGSATRVAEFYILPAELKPWHLIGRGCRFLKPMLVRNPSVRVRFQDTPTIPSHGEVRITGMPGEAVNIHFELHARLKVERII